MTLSEFLNTIMSNFLLAISQSPLLQGLFGVWLLLALFNQDHRKILVGNIAFFLRMPLTYEEKKDTDQKNSETNSLGEKNDMPLYPRQWFEDGYKGLKSRLVGPIKAIDGFLMKGITSIGTNHTLDSIMGGIFLTIFIYADIIGGINIISLVPGLISWNVPPWLSEYSITVVAGTILSVIVSAWMIGSILEKESSSAEEKKDSPENISQESKAGKENLIRKTIARILLVSSFTTIIGINLIKLPVFIPGLFTQNVEDYIQIISNVFLHVIVMFNAAMATFLLDAVGRKGLSLLALAILFPLYIFFALLTYLLDLLTSIGPISLDILIRIIFVILNIVTFYIIAPIDLGVDIFSRRKK